MKGDARYEVSLIGGGGEKCVEGKDALRCMPYSCATQGNEYVEFFTANPECQKFFFLPSYFHFHLHLHHPSTVIF